MANGLFGSYAFIPEIASNIWKGLPVDIVRNMFADQNPDVDSAVNDYINQDFDVWAEDDEWANYDDEESLWDSALSGLGNLVDEAFDAADKFMHFNVGGKYLDELVDSATEFADGYGIDIESVLSDVGNTIADAAGSVLSSYGQIIEDQAELDYEGMKVLYDSASDVIGTASDWVWDQMEEFGETELYNSQLQHIGNLALKDMVLGAGISSETQAKGQKLMDDKAYSDDIKELRKDLEDEGLTAFLNFIREEVGVGGAINRNSLEGFIENLRQSGDEFDLTAAKEIEAVLHGIDKDAISGGYGTDTTEPTTETTWDEWAEDDGDTTTITTADDTYDGDPTTITTAADDEDVDKATQELIARVTADFQPEDEVFPGDVDDLIPSYRTQFDRYFSTLGGSASYDAQQRKGDLYYDADMLFYLNTDWSDREWMDPDVYPVEMTVAGGALQVPSNITDLEHVKKEEEFYSNWLKTDYFGKDPKERFGPDFYSSVEHLRDDMYELRGIPEHEFNEKLATGEIGYDAATDRAAFMGGDPSSNNRLALLVAKYNIHPGADTWMQNQMRVMYKGALDWWINDGRSPEDFMKSFVKDRPGTDGVS